MYVAAYPVYSGGNASIQQPSAAYRFASEVKP